MAHNRAETRRVGDGAIRPVSHEIFDVDTHRIPSRGGEPESLHYDVRFLLEAGRTAPLAISAESRSLEWVALPAIAQLNPEASISRMVAKTLRRFLL